MRAFKPLTIERVLESVQYDQVGGCWLWDATTDTPGYAQLGSNGQRVAVHRWVLEQRLGRSLQPGLLACHRCNISYCVNPNHIYEGTWSDNARDRERAHGPRVGVKITRRKGPKLASDQARAIFLSLSSDEEIARNYGISAATVAKIKRGEMWRSQTKDLGPVRRRPAHRPRGTGRPFITVAMRRAMRRKGLLIGNG